jgi:transcriptional regulator with XRE-family HTH domain
MTLDQYLKATGESDAAFASKVKLSTSQINRLRRGASKPSWEAVVAIEKATRRKVKANDWAREAAVQ